MRSLIILAVFATCLLSSQARIFKLKDGSDVPSRPKNLAAPKGNRVVIEGRNYFFSTDFLPVWRAFQECDALGMKMVCIETEGENTALRNWMTMNGYGGQTFSTGGCRESYSTTWVWSPLNNAPMTYTNWNIFAGEPDYKGPDDACMGLAPSTGWLDQGCYDGDHHYICEQM